VAVVLVSLERQEGHPEFGRVIPCVTLRLNTTARSMHHADLCNKVYRSLKQPTGANTRKTSVYCQVVSLVSGAH
jgi:hypothetical protein